MVDNDFERKKDTGARRKLSFFFKRRKNLVKDFCHFFFRGKKIEITNYFLQSWSIKKLVAGHS